MKPTSTKRVLGVILDRCQNEGLVFTSSYSPMVPSKQVYEELVSLLKRMTHAEDEIARSSRDDKTAAIYRQLPVRLSHYA